jgi:hypothetical protein
VQAMKAGDTALSGGEYSAAIKFYSQARAPTVVPCWPQNQLRYATNPLGCADV